MANSIVCFIKFFAEEQYADQFIEGRLHLKRLSYFKQMEESSDPARSDSCEAIAALLQAATTSIKFASHPELNIEPKHLAAPVRISFDLHNDWFVFCIYAVHTGRFECISGLIDYAEAEESELNDQLKIHTDNLQFGKYAVVFNCTEFISRFEKAIKTTGYKCQARLVDYYDPRSIHGGFPLNDIPFKKQQKFSYQNEYRIAVDTGTSGDNPIEIEIGTLSDIAAKIQVDSTNLNEMIKLNRVKIV